MYETCSELAKKKPGHYHRRSSRVVLFKVPTMKKFIKLLSIFRTTWNRFLVAIKIIQHGLRHFTATVAKLNFFPQC